MDGLLTAVKTISTADRRGVDTIGETVSQKTSQGQLHESVASSGEQCTIRTPQEAQKCLRSGPTDSQLLQVIRFLDPRNAAQTGYDIRDPEPLNISILNSLIDVAVNERWTKIENEHKVYVAQKHGRSSKAIILRCLTSVSGIGALNTNLRTSLDKITTQQGNVGSGMQLILRDTLIVLSHILLKPSLLLEIYQNLTETSSPARRRLAWSQLLSFLASGRVLSTASEVLATVKDGDIPTSVRWLGDGRRYASWIGRSIVPMAMVLEDGASEGWGCLAKFSQRSLSLGYTSEILKEIYPAFLLQPNSSTERFAKLVTLLEPQSQKRVFDCILHDLEETYLPSSIVSAASLDHIEVNRTIRGVSSVVATTLDVLPTLSQHLIDCLVKGVGVGIRGISMRRALTTIFGHQKEILAEMLEKGIALFGDELYIKHTPQMAQEANAQVILLLAGYLHRSDTLSLANITKSGPYLSAITHRIGASLPRSRFLGMVVGMGLSKLTDSPETALKFQSAEMQSPDAVWYMNLTGVNDQVGSLDDLPASAKPQSRRLQATAPNVPPPASRRPGHIFNPNIASAKVISIEEISDELEEEDDLYEHEKPDTDASDLEEDPTLIDRSKPSAPVYVRDLVSALRDTENPERYHQAISATPELIRRKAAFGTEVLENANELALQLVSLQDKYDMPQFHEYRLASLVALIVSLPSEMGRWMAHALFNIDLSLSHRSTILVAIGLSARELAGHGDEDAKAMGLNAPITEQTFPSKRLPEHLEGTYGSQERSIENISHRISQSILEPLALTAADTLTGPAVMKLQSLSSRAKDVRERQEREFKRKQKNMPKGMYEILSKGFLLPLLGEFNVMMYTMRSFGNNNPFLEPHLIALFVQTVALLVSTMGPHSPTLNLSTNEIFSLLITLHNLPIASEPIVLPAILSLFLAMVDVNIASGSTAEESLVTQFATSILELREWVDTVFEQAPKENEQLRALAAGVMVKLEEVTRRYQGRLLGLNSKFEY